MARQPGANIAPRAFYVDLLRDRGFEVETGSAGMPTAFCAVWENGPGPTLAGYAEYDGIPGNCQAADTMRRPRDGLSAQAGGHTDPHSALGIASLAGLFATQHAMKTYGIPGRLKFFGEPAEKLRGSKPLHAARGYYDDLDAAISFHPFYMLPLCNTVRWDTHCGAAYALIYSFICDQPETWLAGGGDAPIPQAHAAARAPGATDGVVQMYLAGKALKEHLAGSGLSWSMNEAILTAGQATADNIPGQTAQIQYIMRVPTLDMAEHLTAGLDHYADSAARMTHCSWRRDWVSKSRPGLANHVMARTVYRNLAEIGPPRFDADAMRLGREIQSSLGLEPMDDPFLPETSELIEPETAEATLRHMLPPSQTHFTSDDYTEYCWHAPTARFYVGRPSLRPPAPGFAYPAWAMNALGGLAPCIDPMTSVAAKTIAGAMLDLLTDADTLKAAQDEFRARTGGGVGGQSWLPPLADYDPPIHFRWPEYVDTTRGRDWVIPTPPDS